jgi:hypothetical protein
MLNKNLAASFVVLLFLAIGCGVQAAAAQPLKVEVEAAKGIAAPQNNQPATILVLVSEADTGAPVTDLIRENFVVVDYGGGSQPRCGFTENVVAFGNALNGAYQLDVVPQDCPAPPGPTWVAGTYLVGVSVRPSPTVQRGHGQGGDKLILARQLRLIDLLEFLRSQLPSETLEQLAIESEPPN